MEQIRKEMISNIKAYNKHADKKWLNEQETYKLLTMTHPEDRQDFTHRIEVLERD